MFCVLYSETHWKGASALDDTAIIKLFHQRDERAIRAADAAYGNYCRSIAMRILGSFSDAEECVNDTFLRAWNTIPPQCPAKLSLYLGRIARNLSIDRARKNRAAKRDGGNYEGLLEELEPFLPCAETVEQAVEDAALREALNRFLHTLSRRDCTLFLRRYFYADSVPDAAKQCGVSESNAKVILHRTRKKLQLFLEREELYL